MKRRGKASKITESIGSDPSPHCCCKVCLQNFLAPHGLKKVDVVGVAPLTTIWPCLSYGYELKSLFASWGVDPSGLAPIPFTVNLNKSPKSQKFMSD